MVLRSHHTPQKRRRGIFSARCTIRALTNLLSEVRLSGSRALKRRYIARVFAAGEGSAASYEIELNGSMASESRLAQAGAQARMGIADLSNATGVHRGAARLTPGRRTCDLMQNLCSKSAWRKDDQSLSGFPSVAGLPI